MHGVKMSSPENKLVSSASRPSEDDESEVEVDLFPSRGRNVEQYGIKSTNSLGLSVTRRRATNARTDLPAFMEDFGVIPSQQEIRKESSSKKDEPWHKSDPRS